METLILMGDHTKVIAEYILTIPRHEVTAKNFVLTSDYEIKKEFRL